MTKEELSTKKTKPSLCGFYIGMFYVFQKLCETPGYLIYPGIIIPVIIPVITLKCVPRT